MKTTYANMVGSICLDKAKDWEGIPAPIEFTVKAVTNGHQPWQQGRFVVGTYKTLEDAVKALHGSFLRHVEEDRFSASPSFWLENFQAARSKWENWLKREKHSFAYDNYTVCIVTSNGDLVY